MSVKNALNWTKHFTLVCKTFTNARNFLFSEVGKLIPGFEFDDENDMFKILFCEETVLPAITGNFLYKSLCTRTFLVQNPQNTD